MPDHQAPRIVSHETSLELPFQFEIGENKIVKEEWEQKFSSLAQPSGPADELAPSPVLAPYGGRF